MQQTENQCGVGEARIEQELDPAAVDVERFEDFHNLFHRQTAVDRPDQDVEVLLAHLQPAEDLIDQRRVAKLTLQETKIVVVELDPVVRP